MMEYMSKVAESGSGGADAELSVEERNLLSVAYKSVIGARRASWRIVSSIETKEESKYTKESDVVRLIQKYKGNVEKELRHLRPHPQAAEGPPGGDVVLGREQGLLQEDEGRLLPLPRGV